jgi:cytochrome b
MIRVWDIPIRLFHWLLVMSVIGLFVTGKLGGNWMIWHERIGYFVLGLLLFRLIWGVVGSTHARFVNFVRGPRAVWSYVRTLFGKARCELESGATQSVGHNPLGALSVIVMLCVLLFQVVSGLFADDDILLRGPYASMVGSEWSSLLTKLHKWNSDVILVLIAIHILAILFYTYVKKESLIKPMITGLKNIKSPIGGNLQAKMAENSRPAWLSWILLIIIATVVYFIVGRATWSLQSLLM